MGADSRNNEQARANPSLSDSLEPNPVHAAVLEQDSGLEFRTKIRKRIVWQSFFLDFDQIL
jgi:hypothetical protein